MGSIEQSNESTEIISVSMACLWCFPALFLEQDAAIIISAVFIQSIDPQIVLALKNWTSF